MSLEQKRESRALDWVLQVVYMQAYYSFGKVGRSSHAVVVLVHAAKDGVLAMGVCGVDPFPTLFKPQIDCCQAILCRI